MSAPRTFKAHVRDSAFHARQLHKSLRDASKTAQTRAGAHDAERLSEQALELARTLERSGA